ncbi:hypothetical protein [Geminocystis sp. CENA526]|uniref:hypothetical protein n=1 Tax=Geminocystis sp. CENA526 TaxID=1355871 RepID=UPI003D6FE01F
MSQTLLTNYPHGIVYILQNTLKHLDNFGINYLPWKSTDGREGWPNKTVLKEAIEIARYAVEKWDSYEPVEKTTTIANIRQMIQPEVMEFPHVSVSYNSYDYYFHLEHINEKHHNIDIYYYYYNDDDYRRDTGNQPPKPDFPTTYQSSPQPEYEPTPQTQPEATQQVLTLREFLAQNTGLLYLSEAEQQEEYHKYLADMGVKPPSS